MTDNEEKLTSVVIYEEIRTENVESVDLSQDLDLKLKESMIKKRWGNQVVLIATTSTFAVFVVALIIGALASGSLSLLGDAAAMSVDVFTYCSNMYAERVKSRSNGVISHRSRIILEIVIPAFSVSALIAVTTYIFVEAVHVILYGGVGDEVDVSFLYGYSIANAFVDLFCAYMFYQGGKNILYNDHILIDEESNSSDGLEKDPKKNVNMMSALVHVSGDTLRTISVFAAAVVTTAANVSGTVTDAWAAVVVTATIIAIVMPLIREIGAAILELLF
jgi:Co/Zn/Cd efflux system component